MKNSTRVFLSEIKKAIIRHSLIVDGDIIGVGISGGKDSIALLYSLCDIIRSAPVRFKFIAILIDLGWLSDLSPIVDFCQQKNIQLHIEPSDIAKIVFEIREEKQPCSLCAKMRRGALHNTAKMLGCNKVALGHHLDDVIETFFLNLIYTGQMKTFLPAIYLDRSDITLIRPMIYVTEDDVVNLVGRENLPVVSSNCPVDGKTKREEIKSTVALLASHYPDFRSRFLTALKRPENPLWTDSVNNNFIL
ncbi:PP-loop domain protein [Desulfofarcimen acetoxidans DSM 771]|uniref:PP-loop domain protein n=1 Tax=Desulfofarcimen acetoxidans (strain ATCC 49208 / DSM 771 / KCTC 5769 / VKM B-1644 / 5575) TaxID=485916 RepID=C8W0C3_DESAS|nr:tRNA 2-thiocytidine biosynthesis TtcA family protein [Desulfofarcimen acetoxidans]ACV63178.1 PP-loop domain protein [Desulfofarcimen acetoxidans DSM 771]